MEEEEGEAESRALQPNPPPRDLTPNSSYSLLLYRSPQMNSIPFRTCLIISFLTVCPFFRCKEKNSTDDFVEKNSIDVFVEKNSTDDFVVHK